MRTCPECESHYEDEILHCPEDGFNLTGIEPVDELIGRSVGSYKILKPLGKGGMGAVYMGEHPVIGSKVAIKFLHPQYATDQKIVDRFFNEARAVNVIGHDNILKILDLNVTEDNRHYFVMEYLQGRALQNIVRPNQPLSLEVAGPILLQTCNALQAAHNKNIIHRDLKPDNVYLISMNGRKNFVKVVDFGIAKLTDVTGANTGKTQTGMVMGTPAYMSPEQGSGETNKIDGRSDVYSLGVMMYQMAVGKLPFPGSNFGEVLMGHLQKEPPPPRSVVPEIPEDYEAVILKTLEKRQEDRYQTMAELYDAVHNVMQAHGISAELPLADETEELSPVSASPSNPGARTPSRPGRTNPGAGPVRASNPGKQNSNPPRQFSNPPKTAQVGKPRTAPGRSHTGQTRPPELQAKSKMPLVLGGGGAVLAILVAVIFWLVHSGNVESEKSKVAADRVTAEAAKAAKAIKDAPAEETGPVFLSVVSEPLGADVEASWKGEQKSGTTPLSLEVPKNAKVRLEFKKSGFVPQTLEIIADAAQTVTATLKAAPIVQANAEEGTTPPDGTGPSTGSKKKGKKGDKKGDLPPQKDGLIDLGDAFK